MLLLAATDPANPYGALLRWPAGGDAASSLGMTPSQCLRHVQLPLAMPTLLAGVKTAAVINVGTATMAAFIGAGGFGERIVAGLAVNDSTAMLAGALPAAALALVVQALFDTVERRFMNGTVAGQALLKTGSLEGVRALAGYVIDGEGRRFVVTAIINHKNAAGAAGALDNLVQWVYQNGATWDPASQH